nr:hypothetical protein [Desulfobacula sp.]
MPALKGIQRYLIYACIAGGMFFLGVVVGRGTSPVTFDTQEFSKKLEKMANIPQKEAGKKVDLKFYEDLDHPTTQERLMPKASIPEPVPEKEVVKEASGEPAKEPAKEPVKEPVKEAPKESAKEPAAAVTEPVQEPVKVIKKLLTKDPARLVKKEPAKEVVREQARAPEKPPVIEPGKETGMDKDDLKTEKTDEAASQPLIGSKGSYTIQIAAYKSFQEAVSKMSDLEEKGFPSYRIKGEKNGIPMYRVRTGPFETYDAAKEFKARLDKAGIEAMIMKRETDEDIKE